MSISFSIVKFCSALYLKIPPLWIPDERLMFGLRSDRYRVAKRISFLITNVIPLGSRNQKPDHGCEIRRSTRIEINIDKCARTMCKIICHNMLCRVTRSNEIFSPEASGIVINGARSTPQLIDWSACKTLSLFNIKFRAREINPLSM